MRNAWYVSVLSIDGKFSKDSDVMVKLVLQRDILEDEEEWK